MAPKAVSFASREEGQRAQRIFVRSLNRNSERVYPDPCKDLCFRHYQAATPTEKDRLLSLFQEDRSCKWITESARWMDFVVAAPVPAAPGAAAAVAAPHPAQ